MTKSVKVVVFDVVGYSCCFSKCGAGSTDGERRHEKRDILKVAVFLTLIFDIFDLDSL